MDANRQAVAQMRRRIGERERAEIFARAGGVCHICQQRIDAGRDAWEVSHEIPLELGGDDAKGSANLLPAHGRCHRERTAGEDVPAIRKAQRLERRSMGIKRQPKGRGFRGWRTLSGAVVWRD